MVKRWLIILTMLCMVFACAAAENDMIGKWAYTYMPETMVLDVDADGTAWFLGKEYTWEDQGNALTMADAEGETFSLRYVISETENFIYPHTVYQRGKEVEGQGGLIGIWEGKNDGSSFVFTPAGYFLEDNSFSGNFMIDQEAGTFLLHYGDAFADTLCYYSISEDDLLTVEYPWAIEKMQ